MAIDKRVLLEMKRLKAISIGVLMESLSRSAKQGNLRKLSDPKLR